MFTPYNQIVFNPPRTLVRMYRWLAIHDRMPEARRSLARTRGVPVEEAQDHPVLNAEADDIQANALYEAQFKSGWIDCFKVENKTLYRTLLGKFPRRMDGNWREYNMIHRHVVAKFTTTYGSELLLLLWCLDLQECRHQ